MIASRSQGGQPAILAECTQRQEQGTHGHHQSRPRRFWPTLDFGGHKASIGCCVACAGGSGSTDKDWTLDINHQLWHLCGILTEDIRNCQMPLRHCDRLWQAVWQAVVDLCGRHGIFDFQGPFRMNIGTPTTHLPRIWNAASHWLPSHFSPSS